MGILKKVSRICRVRGKENLIEDSKQRLTKGAVFLYFFVKKEGCKFPSYIPWLTWTAATCHITEADTHEIAL